IASISQPASSTSSALPWARLCHRVTQLRDTYALESRCMRTQPNPSGWQVRGKRVRDIEVAIYSDSEHEVILDAGDQIPQRYQIHGSSKQQAHRFSVRRSPVRGEESAIVCPLGTVCAGAFSSRARVGAERRAGLVFGAFVS